MHAGETETAELDRGPRQTRSGHAKSVRERACIVSRTVKPLAELIRFVVAPDGAVVADLKATLPGRGAWVTATREAVTEAVRRKAFARAFGKPVTDTGLVAQTEALLERSALDALAIAGKAGQTASGFAKVEAALARDPVLALLHASDGAADGLRKLESGIWRRFGGEDGQEGDESPVRTITSFSSAQLDLALGRASVVHAAVLAGPAGDAFLSRCSRLDRFRAGNPGDGRNRKASTKGVRS